MSLKHTDIESAMRRLADRRIEEAMREGKFDNLPGAGKPIDLEPLPADENARMLWWALKLMRQNDFTPDEIRYRKQIDHLKQELESATTPQRITALVAAVNAVVRQLNTMGTNAIKSAVVPVVLEEELEKLHQRQRAAVVAAESAPLSRPRTPGRCINDRCSAQNPTSARFCHRCGGKLQPA